MRDKNDMHPGIIGLRAIAVLAVVVFHFAPTLLPGGFIGVDLFFVISGYLISRSIYSAAYAGNFSLSQFYERRARRIFPALFAMTAATFVAGYFILLPPALDGLANSTLASLAFSANIFFYSTSNYFSPTAEELPLLHLWSLGIEEQFYLIFPVFVALMLKWRPHALAGAICALLVISALSGQIALQSSPPTSFYLPWNRAFELLIGAALALPAMRPANARSGPLAAIAGILIIAASLWLIDTTTAFPGFTALAPCAGAAFVVWGAHSLNQPIAKWLSVRPLTFFSNISYSLYLVHWPILVYGRMLFPETEDVLFAIYGTILSIAVGYLSFRYIEQPTRLKRIAPSTRKLASASIAAFAFIFAAALTTTLNNGFPGRMAEKVEIILASLKYDPKPAFETEICFMEPHQDIDDYKVDLCIPKDRPLAIIWGDSHVSQYLYGLRPLFAEHGYSIGQFGSSGCAPALGVETPKRPKCRIFNDFALSQIISVKPSLVILGAVWDGSSQQLDGLGRSISTLEIAGIKVVVFGNAPFYKNSVPNILAERIMTGNASKLSDKDLETDFVVQNNNTVREYLRNFPSAQFVSILDTVCGTSGCPLEFEGHPLHFDIAHVTDVGSTYYAERIFPQMEPLL